MLSKRTLLSASAFFVDSYDLFIINLVTIIMGKIYEQSIFQVSLISTIALIGSMIGQIISGFLADYIGRRVLFFTTALGVAFTSLGCGLLTIDHPSFSIYSQLAIWRFFLGVLIGCDYVISAIVSRENAASTKSTAIVFATQGLGSLMGCLLITFCLWQEMNPEIIWRLAFSIPAIPALVTFYPRLKLHESIDFQAVQKSNTQLLPMDEYEETTHFQSIIQELRALNHGQQNYIWLIGTSLSWFLFDIAFYSNSLASATIIKAMNLGTISLLEQAQNTTYVTLIALPGYLIGIFAVPYFGLKFMQNFGFCICGLLYLFLAVGLEDLKHEPSLLLISYGATFLFSNLGPNATTFISAVRIFPTRIRGTAQGISAACGKLGAIIGTAFLHTIYEIYGLQSVFMICGCVSFLGLIVTKWFIPNSLH